MISISQRKELIDREESSFSLCHQCELLGFARSTLYYTPATASNLDLMMIKELDMQYLEDPTRGTRRMTREIRKKGYRVGRHHVRRLMQIMRLKTVYCRPRTTIQESRNGEDLNGREKQGN